MQHGLDTTAQKQRLTLFGHNVIDIEGKSTISLLVEEVYLCLVSVVVLSIRTFLGYPPILRVPNR